MQHSLILSLSLSILIAFLSTGCGDIGSRNQTDSKSPAIESNAESTPAEENEGYEPGNIEDQVTEFARALEKAARTKTEEVKPVLNEMSTRAINDIKALSQWEYMTEKMDISSASPEVRLNTLGKDGWELVTVVESNGEQIFIYKRRPMSVFRNIPASDILKIITLMQ